MRFSQRFTIFGPLIVIALLIGWQLYGKYKDKPATDYKYYQLLADIKEQPKRFKSVVLQGQNIRIEFNDVAPPKNKITVVGPEEYDQSRAKLAADLNQAGIKVEYGERKEDSIWVTLLGSWLPFVLLMVGGVVLFRYMQSGPKGLQLGRARIKTLNPENKEKITFADVAGIEESKYEVQELVEFLKDPQKFTKLGGKIPRGVLLTGSPGTGKTLLARAIAGEANVPFFSTSGSEFDEMLVGMGASRMRDLFEQAKRSAPCIIFIDEIDAVGRQRSNRLRGHPGEEQTLNQLLVELDGFDPNEGIILVGATNRPDVLDPALLRPGRFDRHITVPLPDVRGREEILKVHTRKIPLAIDVSLVKLARGTPGFSGAELASLVNEGALLAARQGKEQVSMKDLEEAKSKVLMGPERKSMVISDQEKRITAFHEAGHALVARLIPHTDPVHMVTIIPRGPALGVTQQLPTEDRFTTTKDWIEARIAVCMGGRVAEQLTFGHLSTGASNDLEQATGMARKMVCEWGMSEKLGPLTFGTKERGEMALLPEYSQDTARLIDDEVRRIVVAQHERVHDLLKANLPLLQRVAGALLEQETLHEAELEQLLA